MLRNWSIRCFGDYFSLSGFCDNHPSLGRGALVYTSEIEQLSLKEEDKSLEFVTASGSIYESSLDEIDYRKEVLEKTRAYLCEMNISASLVDEAVVLAKRKERAFKKSLAGELLNGDLYLEVGECFIVRAYFKYNGEVLRLYGRCHSGIFKDSYLYTKGGIVDFRHYQFGWRSVNTYHISDTIQRLAVNNISGDVVYIDGKEYPVGQTITCVTKENHQEGLISPDVVNGKSLFADFGKDIFEEE